MKYHAVTFNFSDTYPLFIILILIPLCCMKKVDTHMHRHKHIYSNIIISLCWKTCRKYNKILA